MKINCSVKYHQKENNIIFGAKIGLINNSKLTSFAMFRLFNGKIISSKPLTKKELLKIGMGEWPAGKTPPFFYFKNKNLKIYKVINGSTLKEEWYCNAFDSLWKVRFSEHPYSKLNKKGWSNGYFKPSSKQKAFIHKHYGVVNFEKDYFLDTNFFKIMRDVQSKAWIMNYMALK